MSFKEWSAAQSAAAKVKSDGKSKDAPADGQSADKTDKKQGEGASAPKA